MESRGSSFGLRTPPSGSDATRKYPSLGITEPQSPWSPNDRSGDVLLITSALFGMPAVPPLSSEPKVVAAAARLVWTSPDGRCLHASRRAHISDDDGTTCAGGRERRCKWACRRRCGDWVRC